MALRNTMNGSNLIIKFGINMIVINNGKPIPISKFLKNSISSNKLKITPRQIKAKRKLKIVGQQLKLTVCKHRLIVVSTPSASL